MQCVKLRSVMGSYLNIHLNLFPIYVLLLLLTLSHGRPSAKVRETGEPKSQRPQFRDNWYELSSVSSSNQVSVSNAKSSVSINNIEPISHNFNAAEQQVSVSAVVTSPAVTPDKEEEALLRATGSQRDAMEGNLDTTPSSATELAVVGVEKAEAHAPQFPTAGRLPVAPNTPESSTARGASDVDGSAHEEGNQNDHGQFWHPNLNSNGDDGISTEISLRSHSSNVEKREAISHPSVGDEHGTNSIIDDETDEEYASQQQLGNFRRNILRSLGHSEDSLEFASAINASITYKRMDTLAKYNISKEEYLQAYSEYMSNVKKRRLESRGLVGVKDRRKNAVTIARTYHDNGTDLFSIGSKVLKLFRFDILYTPTMEGTDVRMLRVVLNLPAMCQLTGHLRNDTNLPDLQELSQLAAEGEECDEGNEAERVTQIDLTRNVTSWSIKSHTSSPFIVMAICSRDGLTAGSHESTQTQQQQKHHRRHASHHGSSLKVVTKEFMKPSLETKLKRRSRRATASEPSTLSSFNNKRDIGVKGKDCSKLRHGKTCCRKSLKIKFSDLGISDVILEPQEFDAFVCDGRCNAKRVAYTSTHAMFQHILHQTKGKTFAPRPCCVPTALSELDVLHLDPNGNRNGGPKLIITILKDAIVKECGCS